MCVCTATRSHSAQAEHLRTLSEHYGKLSTQLSNEYPDGMEAEPPEQPQPALPAKEELYCWTQRLRCDAKAHLQKYTYTETAAKSGPRGAIPMPDFRPVAQMVQDSIMADWMCGYTPPVRGAATRSIQVRW